MMNSKIKKLKALLKKIIKDSKELNQQVVSNRVGISQPYLNEILNDNKSGSIELLDKIADAIGVSLQNLLSQIDSNESNKRVAVENDEEEQLLTYYRGLDTQKRFLLLNIAADYYKYCSLVKSGKIKPE